MEAVDSTMKQVEPVMKDLEPHVAQMHTKFNDTVQWLIAQIGTGMQAAARQVPALAPHVATHGTLAAKITAYAILTLPLGSIVLLIYFAVVRRMSVLLLKLEYALLFLLLGVVAAVSALAFVTKKDPIAQLRAGSIEKYT